MYQFFVSDEQVGTEKISITGTDVNHIKNVLRMKNGDRIRISDDRGVSYFCLISEISETEIVADIDEIDELGTELSNRIVLFQGLPKGDKMELIIQKAVELGAAEIIPVAMKNCVVKLDDKRAAKKIVRWQAIAESAAKQSKRTVIPKIGNIISFKEAVKMAQDMDVRLVPYENQRGMEATREVMSAIEPEQSISIMIGPEGGFADSEIELINSSETKDFHLISLGRRILRTETAGLTTLAMLIYQTDF